MTRFRRDEDGMAMITIILSLTIMMALAVAAIQYGLGSQDVSKRDQDWQSALSAAEAGLDNYQFHVNENANYIAYSASNPPPDGNLAFSQYVAVPGGNTAGTYRYTADVTKVGVDGTITVTSTGKVGNMKRTVQSIVRRRSFLDYLYFTEYETQDPAAYSGNLSDGNDPSTVCARHYYDSPARDSNCNDIQFISADTINGPLHSNDAILMCGTPNFKSTVSTSWTTTGTKWRSGCGGTNPTFANPGDPQYIAPLSMPPSNSALKAETTTAAGGCLYTGPTRIKLLSSGKMTVKSPFSKQTNNSATCPTNGTTQTSQPVNGVIYVQNVPATSSDPNYTSGCPYSVNGRTHPLGLPITNDNTTYGCRNGDVFIEGTLKGQLSVAADNNIDVTWSLTYNSGTAGTDLLGLIANNYIEIWHPVSCTSGSSSSCNLDANFPGETARNDDFHDATVQAAILAVNHSFRVQNYNLGAPLGTLNILGAIAQRYRGAVGTGSGGSVSTGFAKSYVYDQRLKYQSPPKFLAPISASWAIAVWKEIPVPAGMLAPPRPARPGGPWAELPTRAGLGDLRSPRSGADRQGTSKGRPRPARGRPKGSTSSAPASTPACSAAAARAHGFPARTEIGMTLVELMVAISILAIVMSGLALSIGVDYKAVALARARQVAESAANQRLEELRDVDYASMALSSQPVHSTDTTNPDYYVSTNGATYDVTGTGQNEALIVDSPDGPVDHLESPVTVGTTVVDIYQYVTWVDDPSIPGTQNLKRLTVVVQYHSVPTIGQARMLRESVVLTSGNVTLGSSGTTTTSSSTTTTSSSSTTTTTTATSCGSFSIAGSSGASGGYTASTTVTITMSLTGCGGNIYANFSNDGGTTWGSDFAYSSSATTLAWTLTSGTGTKTISGRARSGLGGTPWSLTPQSIILDTTPPTTPASIARTVSCSGSTRTVVLAWTAASDTYLVGYHIYVSSDGTTYSLSGSASGLSYTTTNSKNSVVYYKVKAYGPRPETNPVRLRSSSCRSNSARRRGTGEAGVTMVELMITSALLMVVLLAAFDSFDTVSKSQAFQADRSVSINDMRNSLNLITKELRQATSVTQPTSTPSSTLTYVTNINNTPTTVTYTVTGTCSAGSPNCALTRQVGSGTAYTVLKRLTDSGVFTPTSATDVTGIQWVEIDLSAAPVKSPNTTLSLQSKVNLRNRTAALTGTTS